MISTPGGDIYSVQELIAQGFTGYQGWNDPEAGYNFKETKGAGKGGPTTTGSQTVESIAQSIIDANKKQIEDETGYLKKYTTENPFVFDEVFAKESAKQEYEPYYQRLLQDYLSGVELKKTSIQDQKTLLTDLYKLDTTSRTNLYDRAITKSEEGFAGKGMFFSGINKRSSGETTVNANIAQERAGVQNQYSLGNLGTQEATLNLETGQQRRDIGEQTTAAIEGGILKRSGEAAKKYYTPMVQGYMRQFPTGSNVLAGYVPQDYLRF